MLNIRSCPMIVRAIYMFMVVSCFMGCGQQNQPVEQGPSYAELVTIYNAELDALDRLETKKERLLQKLAAVGQPSQQEAMQALGNLLSPASQAANTNGSAAPGDPNAALDQAVQQAQAADNVARGMLNSLGNQGQVDPETVTKNEEARQQIEAEIESLEQEIVEQKQRIEKARQARDKAEATALPSPTSSSE